MSDEELDFGEPIDFSEVEGLKPMDPQRAAFEVEAADAVISQSGYPNVRVTLRLTEPEGIEGRKVYDNFSFHTNALNFTKTKLVALGLGDFNGDAGDLAEELIGTDGVVAIGIQDSDPSKMDPETGEPYPPRNVANRYFPPETQLTRDEVASLD